MNVFNMKSALLISFLFFSPLVNAAEQPTSIELLNTLWVVVAGSMVFLMQAGFALLETGMARAKNAVNVMMKNYMDLCVGSLLFWLFGY